MEDTKLEDTNQSTAASTLERRSFCIGAMGALGALSLTSLACGGGGGDGGTTPTPPPPATGLVATTESKASMLAQPDGTVLHFGTGSGCPNAFGTKQGVFLGKDANGIYAMDASCTHFGGLPAIGASALTCPCHGSTFDLNGAVTGGPASTNLKHYQVKEVSTGGMLEVDTNSVVAASTRLT